MYPIAMRSATNNPPCPKFVWSWSIGHYHHAASSKAWKRMLTRSPGPTKWQNRFQPQVKFLERCNDEAPQRFLSRFRGNREEIPTATQASARPFIFPRVGIGENTLLFRHIGLKRMFGMCSEIFPSGRFKVLTFTENCRTGSGSTILAKLCFLCRFIRLELSNSINIEIVTHWRPFGNSGSDHAWVVRIWEFQKMWSNVFNVWAAYSFWTC